MDIKQRLTQLVEDKFLGGSRAEELRELCKDALTEIERRDELLERCLSPIEDEFPATELELTTEIRKLIGQELLSRKS